MYLPWKHYFMRTLFENEKVITEANDKSVVLTNKRIWKENSGGGKSFYQSIKYRRWND